MGGGPEEKRHKETLLIILPQPEPTTYISRLAKNHPDLNIKYIQLKSNGQDLPQDIYKDVTILAGFALPADPIKDAPNLRLIHWFAAGVNMILDHPVFRETNITIFTSSGVHGPQIAEWVIMTALVQSHNYNSLHDLQKKHHWGGGGQRQTVHDMVGQRIGVLGYGSIGRQVGRVAKALGMEVLAYTATRKETKESRRDQGYIVPGTGDVEGVIPTAWFSGLDKKSLHEFLSQDLDMILVSVPLTKATHHLLSTPEFDILSSRKTFITNIARGPIIDQPALISALKDGKLRGAALDVTDPEPLPEDSELWDLENVTVTPHVSGQGSAYIDRAFQILDLNLGRREKGEKMVNVVQREREY